MGPPLSSPQGTRRDVLLVIRILHRRGYDRPIDDREVRCLSEIEARLAQLGAKKGAWR